MSAKYGRGFVHAGITATLAVYDIPTGDGRIIRRPPSDPLRIAPVPVLVRAPGGKMEFVGQMNRCTQTAAGLMDGGQLHATGHVDLRLLDRVSPLIFKHLLDLENVSAEMGVVDVDEMGEEGSDRVYGGPWRVTHVVMGWLPPWPQAVVRVTDYTME